MGGVICVVGIRMSLELDFGQFVSGVLATLGGTKNIGSIRL